MKRMFRENSFKMKNDGIVFWTHYIYIYIYIYIRITKVILTPGFIPPGTFCLD